MPPRESDDHSIVQPALGSDPRARYPLALMDAASGKVYMDTSGQLTFEDKGRKTIEILFAAPVPRPWIEAKRAAEDFYLKELKAGKGKIVARQKVGVPIQPMRPNDDWAVMERDWEWNDKGAKARFKPTD